MLDCMDLNNAIRRLEDAHGDRELLSLATVDVVLDGREPGLRAALEAASIPHWFNAEILGALLQTASAESEKWLQAVRGLPLVESFAARDAWNVHEATRLALRNLLFRTDRDRFVKLTRLAAGCFQGGTPPALIEALYHRLLAEPETGCLELDRTWRAWDEAGLHEPLQALSIALDELIRADQLEPRARAQSLLCVAAIRQGRLTVADAAERLRESLRIFEKIGDEPGQADVHVQLGETLQVAGNREAALREYGKCRDIAERLAARDPGEARWQRLLAEAHSRIGIVFEIHGRFPEAMQEFEADRRILTQLTTRWPENKTWQRDLAICHNFVGGLLEAQDKLDDALREYETYQEIMQQLAGRDPTNVDLQRELSVACNCVGNVHRTQGRKAEALAEFEKSRGILLELKRREPDNPVRLYELALLNNCIGRSLQGQDRLTDALREFAEARTILVDLTGRDPDNTEWQRELSVAHNSAASVLRKQGRLQEALAELEADQAIAETLATLDPTNAQWQQDLQATRSAVADLRKEIGQASA